MGNKFFRYRVARIEKYIDKEGVIREALSYGDKDFQLMVWYNMEEMKQAFISWKVPEVGQ